MRPGEKGQKVKGSKADKKNKTGNHGFHGLHGLGKIEDFWVKGLKGQGEGEPCGSMGFAGQEVKR
jgi:hypothetical protein